MNKDAYKKHPEQLKALAHEAIYQIEKNKYTLCTHWRDVEMNGEIIHIGLAHSGKNVEMEWNET